MFVVVSDGTTAPRGSGSTACAVTDNLEARAATDAAETRCLAISTATEGGVGDRKELFNEGNLINLAERRRSLEHLLHGGFPQESHTFLVCGFLDFG